MVGKFSSMYAYIQIYTNMYAISLDQRSFLFQWAVVNSEINNQSEF